MLYFVLFIHTVVCLAMIVIVLLQADKGEGLSGAFGGGDRYTHFGESGPTTFIQKITQIVAVVFVVTSITLANLSKVSENQPAPLPKQENAQTQPVTDVKVPVTTTQTEVPVVPVKPVEEKATTTKTQ